MLLSRRLLLVIAFILLLQLILILRSTITTAPPQEPSPVLHPKNLKSNAGINYNSQKDVLIFAATNFFQMEISTARFLSECHSTKGHCRISRNPSDYEKADAVLFHNADFAANNIEGKPRNPNVPFVLWSLESVLHDRSRAPNDFINWTMSPRRDSDIWYPYGHSIKKKSNIDLEQFWTMKEDGKMATWLASNCFTSNRRKELIQKIVSLGVEADLYGKCGKPAPNCDGVDKQGYDCVKELVRKYRFYFSFENSNCKDYITEKFWASLGERFAVPIVLERKKYEAVNAPPNSFIAVDDFANLSDLVAHINKVGNSKEEYLKYHEWRREYEVRPEHDDDTGFCELCRRIQKPIEKHFSYPDLQAWQNAKECNQNYADRFL